MAEIRKVAIRKKIYKFDIKRRFQNVKRFKMKKRKKSEELLHSILSVFKARKAAPKKEEPQKPPPADGFNKWIIIGTLAIVAIILAVGWLYLSNLLATAGLQALVLPPQKTSMELQIAERGVITAGDLSERNKVGYIRVLHKTSGLQNYTVKLSTYRDTLPSEIFVLESYREEADGYSEFISELRKNLSSESIVINEIGMAEVETLPSHALVIIPSGIIPQELLGINSSSSIVRLAEQESVIIYIGQPFRRMINQQGAVIPVPEKRNEELGLAFVENVNIQSENNFNLYQPLYTARINRRDFETLSVYGSVSVVKKGSGAILFLPQTLDGGWRDDRGSPDPKLAARDIARIIYETPWAISDGEAKIYELNITKNETNFIKDYYTRSFKEGEFRTVKIQSEGKSEEGRRLSVQKNVYLSKETTGDLFVDGGFTVVPTEISQQQTRMNAILRGEKPESKILFMIISKNGKTVGERIVLGGGRPINIQVQRALDIPLHLDNGEYIASIVDDENNVYASTYLRVVFFDPEYVGQVSNSVYRFSMKRDGQEYELREVNLTVDDARYGTYTFTKAKTIDVDISRYAASLPPGTHAFKFTIGDIEKDTVVTIYERKDIFSEPIFLGTVGLSLVILGVGIYFAKKDEIAFMIDVPDFPPVAKTKIPMNKESVLAIFQRVNDNYKWKYTPLTISEIKNGFKSVLFKGSPIYITDYNVEYLMSELIKSGDAKESLDYYGLSIWENRSGKTIRYLAMFRKLRDLCVNNAVPFTTFGDVSNCDSTIDVAGQQMFVHTYDRTSKDITGMISDVLKSVKNGINIILFKDEGEKWEFQGLLASQSPAMLLLKLEIESNSILLLTVDELDKMLKDLKGV